MRGVSDRAWSIVIVSATGCVFCGRRQSRSPAHPPTERLNTLIAKHQALTHDDNRDLQRMQDQEVLGMALRVACTDGGARRLVLAFLLGLSDSLACGLPGSAYDWWEEYERLEAKGHEFWLRFPQAKPNQSACAWAGLPAPLAAPRPRAGAPPGQRPGALARVREFWTATAAARRSFAPPLTTRRSMKARRPKRCSPRPPGCGPSASCSSGGGRPKRRWCTCSASASRGRPTTWASSTPADCATVFFDRLFFVLPLCPLKMGF